MAKDEPIVVCAISRLFAADHRGVLFFALQAYIGYRTYKHYDRKLTRIEKKLDDLLTRSK